MVDMFFIPIVPLGMIYINTQSVFSIFYINIYTKCLFFLRYVLFHDIMLVDSINLGICKEEMFMLK